MSNSLELAEPRRSATEDCCLNPYEPSTTIETDDALKLDVSTPNDRVGIWLLSFVNGSVLWISLFLGLGFNSEFGNQLTRIYGRDLQEANIDWWLLMVIVIALSMFLHIGTWQLFGRLNNNARTNLTVLVGGIGLLTSVSSIAFYIDSEMVRPIAITLTTITICEYITLRSLMLK